MVKRQNISSFPKTFCILFWDQTTIIVDISGANLHIAKLRASLIWNEINHTQCWKITSETFLARTKFSKHYSKSKNKTFHFHWWMEEGGGPPKGARAKRGRALPPFHSLKKDRKFCLLAFWMMLLKKWVRITKRFLKSFANSCDVFHFIPNQWRHAILQRKKSFDTKKLQLFEAKKIWIWFSFIQKNFLIIYR